MAREVSPSPSSTPPLTQYERTVSGHVSVCVSVPSTAEMCRLLADPRVYGEAFLMMLTTLRQSIGSGLVAFATNLVIAQGFFLDGQAPKDQTYEEFVATTSGYVALFMSWSMVLGFCAPLVKYRWIKQPDVPLSGFAWFFLLLFKSLHHLVIVIALVVVIGYACARLQPSLQPFQLHFYLSGFVINCYTAALDVAARQVYQTETVEGLRNGYVNRQPWWKRIARAYRKNFAFVVTIFIACGYIHVSSRIQLLTQTDLLVFSFVSMAYRFVIMKTARHFVLKLQKVHIRVLYIVATVPTVFINTQVRVALLHVQSNVSLAGVVILAVIEPVMRMLKVWNVRREILRREARGRHHAAPPASAVNSIAVVPSHQSGASSRLSSGAQAVKLPVNAAAASDRRSQRVRRLLQFTAAEIHADMCSEYIAIACSMSIYYCLNDHPKFAWSGHNGANTGGGAQAAANWSLVKLVILQVVIELVVDFLCCVWELVNGLPLRPTPGVNKFLAVVFAGCAVSNITVCCSIYLHDHSK